MSSIKTVRLLKEDLLKELASPGGDGRTEKIMDIVQRLDRVNNMDLAILSDTLIGASVSKLKNHEDDDVASAAKKLVKKWKCIAKQAQGNDVSATAASAAKPAASAGGLGQGASTPGQLKRMASAGSSDLSGEAEWQGLPQLRINICKKLHTIFLLSRDDLSRELNGSAVEQLCLARAGEVEAAIDAWSRGAKQSYTDKVRDLVFNLKKNGAIRDQVILGEISPEQLPRMSAGELQTEEKAKERDETLRKLQDSRRLDWERANEKKINDMCGIKGDLLKASLFTCGRCKSIKTTSTQKQTRSADEPMTVFVLCMNCGNRWKC
jgi:transcription elongation factor S-II